MKHYITKMCDGSYTVRVDETQDNGYVRRLFVRRMRNGMPDYAANVCYAHWYASKRYASKLAERLSR